MKKKVKIFVSYAKKNKVAKSDFMKRFIDYSGADARFDFEFWHDDQLAIGEDWHQSITKALDECDFGLLLLSPAFLQSQYIEKNELPKLIAKSLCMPVALAKLDFKRFDLKGLESKQIYRLDNDNFEQPRAFTDLKSKRKDDFVANLYERMHDQLVAHFKLD